MDAFLDICWLFIVVAGAGAIADMCVSEYLWRREQHNALMAVKQRRENNRR